MKSNCWLTGGKREVKPSSTSFYEVLYWDQYRELFDNATVCPDKLHLSWKLAQTLSPSSEHQSSEKQVVGATLAASGLLVLFVHAYIL